VGGLLFVVALLASVMIHEAGHFFTARAFGMKATQFFVGFGPTLFSRRRGEVEYGLKAIPAGGFVKIIGMIPSEEIAPEDQKRAFWRQPAPQRIIVLAAGSFTHFVVGFMLILGVAFFAPVGKVVPTISAVSSCVSLDQNTSATPDSAGCTGASVAAPAQGVLRVGDTITAVNGTHTASWGDVTTLIRANPGRAITIDLRHGNDVRTVSLTPVAVRPLQSTGGTAALVGAVGIAPDFAYHSPGYSEGLDRAGTQLGFSDRGIIGGTIKGFANIPDRFTTIFDAHRAADGPSSVVGITRISNQAFSAPGEPFGVRLADILLIIASVNVFVGVLNLLPLLPFDGGHIAIVVADQVRAGIARLRRRPAPARIDHLKVAPLSYAVFLVIVAASFLVIVADIGNPVRL
jgi:membrane-associated protease RseP (regulator of RpoE activity)